jgi:phosphoglucomutase
MKYLANFKKIVLHCLKNGWLQKDPFIGFNNELTKEYGEPFYDGIEAKATPQQKEKLKSLSSTEMKHKELTGKKYKSILTNAPEIIRRFEA